jgi:coniferyl-aldehyde dehydrogenase
VPGASADEIASRFAALKAAHAREPYPSVATRRDRLTRLVAIVREREADFVAAIDRDYGHRSSHETRLASSTSSPRRRATRCARYGAG